MTSGVYIRTDRHLDIIARNRSMRKQSYKHSEETKEKISLGNLGKKLTIETRQKLRKVKLGKYKAEDNPNWKGNNVKYSGLHNWIQKHKSRVEKCQCCGKNKKYLEAANISGEYKRDITDFEWLCVSCHQRKHRSMVI